MGFTLEIKDAVPAFPEFRFEAPVNWTVRQGELWAVTGPNGGGKSLLTDIARGKTVLKQGSVKFHSTEGTGSLYGNVKVMEFRDIYSMVDCRNIYYQQRWNASDLGQAPLAGEIVGGADPHMVEEYLGLFGLRGALSKRIISLSSGELRKLLIIRALLSRPRVLILDNPYIGLDAASRDSLKEMLATLRDLHSMAVVTVLSDPGEILPQTDKVLYVDGRKISGPFEQGILNKTILPAEPDLLPQLPKMREEGSTPDFSVVLAMHGVKVSYGGKKILDNVDWIVERGEKWALAGDNGSGKSTLLSLVNGDNPQAYANDITLFDRRRGSGESIWEIKKRIGYLNSDLHTFYMQDIAAIDVAVSGFYDSVGLFHGAGEEKYTIARQWMHVLGIGALESRSFVKLSFGEQRLVLLARTFVKNPAVLILDEPLHGLDNRNKLRVIDTIERYCSRSGITLIYVTHWQNEIPACVDKVKKLVKP